MSTNAAAFGADLPGARYRAGVAARRWEDDPAQHAALAELDRLHAALAAPAGALARLRGALGARAPTPPGLYLWGSVGRGKTFLTDLFFEGLPEPRKLRRHFHRFMAEVHAALRALDHREDPLREVAAQIAGRARVLCLDEFLVADIGDAMILANLLKHLFAHGVALVTTSNTPPARLYRDGLQRASFLPAIALLERHCRVVELVSAHDWRLRALTRAPVYRTPAGAEAERALAAIFERVARGAAEEGGSVVVNERAIALRRRAGQVAWFDFAALCEGPRAVADYIELARGYATVLVSNVPQFTPEMEDEAKRFIHLVDEFYDRRVKLVLSAAAPIVELYDGARLRAEFARTESRLIEMQSEAYLALEHQG
ncbi:MAG: cell division protein ZapE [Mizugakiibacter sp.]|uniref:cell division protein ZapE n=1 Tax=Mizugakiibacter sp. TaxID=1972610 RepID=UPI0031C9263D|nr:cell division protein ZapE [Xanthomonadaceae bacterium]